MKGFNTIREASVPDKLDRSPTWIRAGIKHEKINAVKINKRLWLISDDEIKRIQDNPITISKEEMP